ncbi:hypothetical protein KY285_018537 [Solanum tuberosum]|nr:hypothetical protein KY285_018537 [Solanum tuberosum]
MFVHSIIHDYIPRELHEYLLFGLRNMFTKFSNQLTMVIDEFNCLVNNEIYEAAETYFGNKLSPNIHQLKISKPEKEENFNIAMEHNEEVTLSGLLNFIDGLWSSCEDKRIINFTTNHIKKLDPALLRPGRMDMHIHVIYCTPCGFKLLATNYLGINDHKLFKEIEELIDIANVTPAEVAEQLLKEDEVDNSLKGLINFFHKKIKENEEEKAKKNGNNTSGIC